MGFSMQYSGDALGNIRYFCKKKKRYSKSTVCSERHSNGGFESFENNDLDRHLDGEIQSVIKCPALAKPRETWVWQSSRASRLLHRMSLTIRWLQNISLLCIDNEAIQFGIMLYLIILMSFRNTISIFGRTHNSVHVVAHFGITTRWRKILRIKRCSTT
jgi:hypothetical protein